MIAFLKFVFIVFFGTMHHTTLQCPMTVIQELQETQEIHLTINGIASDEGMLYIGLYNSEETFLGRRYKSAMSRIVNGKVVVVFEDVPEGIYAVSVFHDENNNQKLDTNFMGIPKEDIGCSNNAKGFLSCLVYTSPSPRDRTRSRMPAYA